MKVSVPLVVITGRANVGKSTLFNRLSGKRISIVDSTPGVTRDVVESEIELEGRTVRLMDTGGIELTTSQGHILQQEAEKRAWMVLKDADCVLLVIDGIRSLTGLDQELAARLRKINRHLILVVNKRDGVTHEGIPSDLYTLGWERMVPVSAIHGDGIPALKQVIMECLKEKALPVSVSDPGHPFRVAIVGKPNVGKSTLFNTLLGEDRSIVSDIPGTTRDALESSLESHFGQYRLVDTAGLVRKTRIKEDISFYASVRTMEKIAEAELCVLVIDPLDGINRQDQNIASEIERLRKCCIVFINKMDLVREKFSTLKGQEIQQWAYSELLFCRYAAILVGSASDPALPRSFLPLLAGIATRYDQRVKTSFLNKTIKEKLNDMNFNFGTGRPLRFYYVFQELSSPPRFFFSTNFNGDDPARERCTKMIDKVLRAEIDWEGVPFRIEIKHK